VRVDEYSLNWGSERAEEDVSVEPEQEQEQWAEAEGPSPQDVLNSA
jgi:hypothetical protein